MQSYASLIDTSDNCQVSVEHHAATDATRVVLRLKGKRWTFYRAHSDPWCTCSKCHGFDSALSFGDDQLLIDYCMDVLRRSGKLL